MRGLLQPPPKPSPLLKVFQHTTESIFQRITEHAEKILSNNSIENGQQDAISKVWVECVRREVRKDGSTPGEFYF